VAKIKSFNRAAEITNTSQPTVSRQVKRLQDVLGSGDRRIGRSIERVEDAARLSRRGRCIDDLGVPPGGR
jgi:Bacterial regulatory helix-turn-helix protein, lysR family